MFYYHKPKAENNAFDYTSKILNHKKKKSKEDVKKELLKSIKVINDEFDPNLHEMRENLRKLDFVINVIERYKKITKAQKKNIIKLVAKHGQMLKEFK